MKVVILHPPLYPVDHQFYKMLGKYVDLIIYNFGEYPRLHEHWLSKKFIDEKPTYSMKIFGKGPVDFKTQVNPSFIKCLMQDKPDVVISVAFWIPSFYASLMKKVLNFKFLITTDAILETEKNITSSKKTFRKLICINTDGVISASQLTDEYIHSLCPKIKVYQSLQTIDVNQWQKELEELPRKRILRDELALPNDKTILLGVGNFIEKKNWGKVFEYMQNEDDKIFVLIGSGKLENEYRKYIEKYSLQKKIILVSRKEGIELKQYLKSADIFIFPSLYDQFGYVVPEALASGLPVICTKYAGASSLMQDDFNGYVVDPNKNFTLEIKNVLADKKNMSDNAYASMQKYTLANKVNEYLKIIEGFKK